MIKQRLSAVRPEKLLAVDNYYLQKYIFIDLS